MNDISIIITTYNRRESLIRCLKSVVEQNTSGGSYEIIVIDDGSIPPVKDIIDSYMAVYPNINYQYKRHGGVGSARNLGIIESKGKVLIFVDDDYVVGKEFLRNAKDALKNYPDIKIFHFKIVTDTASFFRRLKQFSYNLWIRSLLYSKEMSFLKRVLNKLPEVFRLSFDVPLDVGGACMVRKEAFFEIGMYDENFNSGEDTDMSLRARESSVKICYYPEISILHYHRTKLSSLVKQKILAGKNSYLLRKKWQGLFYRGSFKETIYLILEPFIIAIKSFLNAKSSEELFVFPFFIFALSVFQSFGFILGALENRSIKKECLFR